MSDTRVTNESRRNFGSATRREALKVLGVAATAGSPMLASLIASGAAAAQSATDYKALVCVFFYGGNDNSNTVIPRLGEAYNAYQSARIPLAIPSSQILPISPIGYSGPELGLSPHLPGLQRLFSQGNCAVLANVGPLAAPTTQAQYKAGSVALPSYLFSHADQQGAWQKGIPDGPSRTGWLGRLGDVTAGAFNSGSQLSIAISVSGNATIMSGDSTIQYQVSSGGTRPIDGLDKLFAYGSGGEAMRQLLTQQRAHLLENQYVNVCSRAIVAEEVLGGALEAQAPLATAFPETNLGGQAQMVARMIGLREQLNQRRQIFFISSGGWDFHDNLLEAQQERLSEVDEALSALFAATEELGVANNVTTFTSSDFGRALQDNGDGVDHGWGSHHFIIGGAVSGQRIYGTWPTTAIGGERDAGQGRLIPTTSVDEYAATLCSWFGVGSSELYTVLPNLSRFATTNLGLLS